MNTVDATRQQTAVEIDPPLTDAGLAAELIAEMAPKPGYHMGMSLRMVCKSRGWGYQRVMYRLRRSGRYDEVKAAKYAQEAGR